MTGDRPQQSPLAAFSRGANWIEDGVLTRPIHIVASPFKTGSSSIGQALLDLGVGTREMPYNQEILRTWRPEIRPLNARAIASKNFAEFRKRNKVEVRERLAGMLKAVAPYDVFHDAPFGHTHIHPFIRRVLAPQARFIWVNRPFNDWIDSVRNWEINHPETYPRHTEWATNPKKRRKLRRVQWRNAHREFRRLRRGARGKCLELEWTDLESYDALAAFYDTPLPTRSFPRRNISRR